MHRTVPGVTERSHPRGPPNAQAVRGVARPAPAVLPSNGQQKIARAPSRPRLGPPEHDATPETSTMIRDLRSKLLALPLAAATLATWAAPMRRPRLPSPGDDPDRQGRAGRLDDRRPGRPPEDHRRRPADAVRHPLGQEPARRSSSGPKGPGPRPPRGSRSTEFATGLTNPRVIMTAPNGDIFVAESQAGRVKVLRDADGDGKPEVTEVFAEGLNQPFGIAFYPPGPNPTHVYVANTDSVVRFPYKNGDTKATGAPETIVKELPGYARLTGGGHWTRDVVFSPDGKRMFVSVGSRSNVDDDEGENRRADILAFDPEGKNEKLYASGIRNPVGLAIQPGDRRALDLGQRARRPGRPPRARLHHPRRGGRLLRLALVLHRRPPGPPPQGQAPRAEGQGDRPRRAPPVALGLARHDLLHRRPVPRRVQGRHLRRRARLVEPGPADRLQGRPRPAEGRQGDRRIRGLPRRLRHPRRRRLGPAGRRGRGQGRGPARHRRRLGHGLAGLLRRQEGRPANETPDGRSR